jgi:hypothetical protein
LMIMGGVMGGSWGWGWLDEVFCFLLLLGGQLEMALLHEHLRSFAYVWR